MKAVKQQQKSWSEDELEAIAKMRESGMSFASIGKAIERSGLQARNLYHKALCNREVAKARVMFEALVKGAVDSIELERQWTMTRKVWLERARAELGRQGITTSRMLPRGSRKS